MIQSLKPIFFRFNENYLNRIYRLLKISKFTVDFLPNRIIIFRLIALKNEK